VLSDDSKECKEDKINNKNPKENEVEIDEEYTEIIKI